MEKIKSWSRELRRMRLEREASEKGEIERVSEEFLRRFLGKKERENMKNGWIKSGSVWQLWRDGEDVALVVCWGQITVHVQNMEAWFGDKLEDAKRWCEAKLGMITEAEYLMKTESHALADEQEKTDDTDAAVMLRSGR